MRGGGGHQLQETMETRRGSITRHEHNERGRGHQLQETMETRRGSIIRHEHKGAPTPGNHGNKEGKHNQA